MNAQLPFTPANCLNPFPTRPPPCLSLQALVQSIQTKPIALSKGTIPSNQQRTEPGNKYEDATSNNHQLNPIHSNANK
jgi:hypothetical protein